MLVVLLIRTVLIFAIMKEVSEIETRFGTRVHDAATSSRDICIRVQRAYVSRRSYLPSLLRIRVAEEEEREQPQSIAASLLAEIENKLAENAAKDAMAALDRETMHPPRLYSDDASVAPRNWK